MVKAWETNRCEGPWRISTYIQRSILVVTIHQLLSPFSFTSHLLVLHIPSGVLHSVSCSSHDLFPAYWLVSQHMGFPFIFPLPIYSSPVCSCHTPAYNDSHCFWGKDQIPSLALQCEGSFLLHISPVFFTHWLQRTGQIMYATLCSLASPRLCQYCVLPWYILHLLPSPLHLLNSYLSFRFLSRYYFLQQPQDT
jgi:hypothetical protein